MSEHKEVTAEQILDDVRRRDKDLYFPPYTSEEDYAGGSMRYTRDDLAEKAMEEYAAQKIAALQSSSAQEVEKPDRKELWTESKRIIAAIKAGKQTPQLDVRTWNDLDEEWFDYLNDLVNRYVSPLLKENQSLKERVKELEQLNSEKKRAILKQACDKTELEDRSCS